MLNTPFYFDDHLKVWKEMFRCIGLYSLKLKSKSWLEKSFSTFLKDELKNYKMHPHKNKLDDVVKMLSIAA